MISDEIVADSHYPPYLVRGFNQFQGHGLGEGVTVGRTLSRSGLNLQADGIGRPSAEHSVGCPASHQIQAFTWPVDAIKPQFWLDRKTKPL